MKLIKEGRDVIKKEWWEGENVICDYCDAIYELEISDFRLKSFFIGTSYVQLKCPNCRNDLQLSKKDCAK
jgi:hypothetical protein